MFEMEMLSILENDTSDFCIESIWGAAKEQSLPMLLSFLMDSSDFEREALTVVVDSKSSEGLVKTGFASIQRIFGS